MNLHVRLVTLCRFFKWLHYPDIEDPQRRIELPAKERKPDCIMGIRRLKRKEISCYKPSDLWTQEDDLVSLELPINGIGSIILLARDLSARPHEILNLRIKDVVFKAAGNKQYAELLVNGKTGGIPIPLIQPIPYVKEWLSNHPSRNNPNSLFLLDSVGIQWGDDLISKVCMKFTKTTKKSSSKVVRGHYNPK